MCLPIKPFRVEAEFEHVGLKCAVTQNGEGQNRCGYVRVPPSNPAYGKPFGSVSVAVHGGLTFNAPEPCTHEDGHGWWFGFDCGHAWDARYDPQATADQMTTDEGRFMLQLRDQLRDLHRSGGYADLPEGHFWSFEDVTAETMLLAEQLAALGS